jgi:(4S)-4-hydroxy-5-phosphonooxypentane-2,3-dione isomerase
MYGHMFKFVAKPGRKEKLVEFLRWDAEVARREEPATLRFDVWDAPEETDAVYVYEAYVDQAAFDTHLAGEPCKKFFEELSNDLLIDEPPVFVLPWAESRVSIADE